MRTRSLLGVGELIGLACVSIADASSSGATFRRTGRSSTSNHYAPATSSCWLTSRLRWARAGRVLCLRLEAAQRGGKWAGRAEGTLGSRGKERAGGGRKEEHR